MSHQDIPNSESKSPKSRKRGFFGGMLVGGLVVLPLSLAFAAFAQFGGPGSHHFGGSHAGFSADRAEFAIDFVLSKVDASDTQKEQVLSIVQSAVAEVKPMMGDRESIHQAVQEILTQPHVDRAALEEIRINMLQKADVASQRMVQTLAEAAEVLTPEQRVELMNLRRQFRH